MGKCNGMPGRVLARIMIALVLLCITMAHSGCEPLRKKFIRKKKEDRKQEVIPVLDPIDYPTRMEDQGSKYKYHYSLFQVFYKDVLTMFSEKTSEKRIVFTINQLIVQLQEMSYLLIDPRQKMIVDLVGQLKDVNEQILEGNYMMKKGLLSNQVKSVGKKVRNNYRYALVKDDIQG